MNNFEHMEDDLHRRRPQREMTLIAGNQQTMFYLVVRICQVFAQPQQLSKLIKLSLGLSDIQKMGDWYPGSQETHNKIIRLRKL